MLLTYFGHGMTFKKDSPILTKTPIPKPTSAGKKKLMVPILLLLLIIIGYFVWSQFLSSPTPTVKDAPSETVTIADDKPVTIPAKEGNSTDSNAKPNAPLTATTDDRIPDAKAILNAPLPETNSLAKEEVDRLNDENQRMVEQEKRAIEQNAMIKEVTDLKAEQIDLLEQQIAQLEANQKSGTK